MNELGQITLNLREHKIGCFVPQGGKLEGKLVLPYGALVCGEFLGDMLCETGSVIIPRGARVHGRIEADRIYVEGEVASDKDIRSILIGRQLVAGSSTSRINADLYSRLFALHKARVWGHLYSFEESEALRLSSSASNRGAGRGQDAGPPSEFSPDVPQQARP